MLAGQPAENHIGRARALALIAMAELRRGEVAAADVAFAEAADEAVRSQAPIVAVPFICSRAEIRLMQGRLREAYEFNQRAMQIGPAEGRGLGVRGFALLGLAKVLYEWNDLAEAEERVRSGLELLNQGGITEAFGAGYGVLALIQQAAGDPAGAAASADLAVHLARASGLARPISEAGAYRARVWLAQGRVEHAGAWLPELARLDVGEALREFEELAVARVLLAQGEAQRALPLLRRLEAAALAAGRLGRGLEAAVLRGLALEASGDTTAALATLEAALKQAEPEGYVRVFLDAGPGMVALLQRLADRPSVAAYARRLLATFAGSWQSAQADLAKGSIAAPVAAIAKHPRGTRVARPLDSADRSAERPRAGSAAPAGQRPLGAGDRGEAGRRAQHGAVARQAPVRNPGRPQPLRGGSTGQAARLDLTLPRTFPHYPPPAIPHLGMTAPPLRREDRVA